jgi:hypothetical protein
VLGSWTVLRGVLPVLLGSGSVAAGAEALRRGGGVRGIGPAHEVDEEGPVPGRRIAVLPAHRPIRGGLGPVVCVLGAGGPVFLRCSIARLGQPVAVFGACIALV